MTADEFHISRHFNLGMTIRNRYFYQNPAQKQLVDSLGNAKEYLFIEGDDFSLIVLEKIYAKIKEKDKK